MSATQPRPTVSEIYELLKRTSLPTVLVEGKDDIIFYRGVEHELNGFDVDMLPAGNKNSVLELKEKIEDNPLEIPVIFVVDNDLWIYSEEGVSTKKIENIITTQGYSIENDMFIDGELESFLSPSELINFKEELVRFVRWYALSINRNLCDSQSEFRTHPGKVLDDEDFYKKKLTLNDNERYPEVLFSKIFENYSGLVRGKSLFALLLRQLSAKSRSIKFSAKQLMAIGASRRGRNFRIMTNAVKTALQSHSMEHTSLR